MDINALTIGNAKEIASMFGNCAGVKPAGIDSFAVGQKVIIRTDRAGVWFGTLDEKSGKEVIIKDARRLWSWKTVTGISLSAIALHGINHDASNIAAAVPSIWMEAIEIIPCSAESISSIEEAPIANT